MAPGLPDTIPEAPRLEYCHGLRLMGHKLRSSLANNRVSELWRGFMPVLAVQQ